MHFQLQLWSTFFVDKVRWKFRGYESLWRAGSRVHPFDRQSNRHRGSSRLRSEPNGCLPWVRGWKPGKPSPQKSVHRRRNQRTLLDWGWLQRPLMRRAGVDSHARAECSPVCKVSTGQHGSARVSTGQHGSAVCLLARARNDPCSLSVLRRNRHRFACTRSAEPLNLNIAQQAASMCSAFVDASARQVLDCFLVMPISACVAGTSVPGRHRALAASPPVCFAVTASISPARR